MTLSVYPRLPSALIISGTLLISLASGLVYTNLTRTALVNIEQQIATSNDTALWEQYANALFEQQRYKHAAQAYEHILTQDPYHTQALFQRAIVLALDQQEDALFLYMQKLCYEHASLSSVLFARSELQPYLSQARFQELAHAARVQAVD